MEYQSQTIKAITDFLFVEKKLSELRKNYELLIFLGNDNIDGNAQILKLLWDLGHITSKSTIILSGNVGSLNYGKEAESIRLFNESIKLGLPSEVFILENQATNALENFKYSKPIAEGIKPLENFDGILCIGSAFMGRRAKMCAAACGFPSDSIDFYGTTDERQISKDDWWKNQAAIKRVLEEIKRIAEYSLKGDLSIQ